jgi:hypothetical protein
VDLSLRDGGLHKEVSELLSICMLRAEGGREGEEKHSDTHQVVLELDSICILQAEEARGERVL